MSSNVKNARDEITELFNQAWSADPISRDVRVFYDDVPQDLPISDTGTRNPPPWARVTIRHNAGSQSSLAGQDGKRRWERSGVVTVQLFTPYGTGLSLADDLAMIVLGAFEGKATRSHVWFRNARPVEIGQDGAWFQTNVIAEFTYDEVR